MKDSIIQKGFILAGLSNILGVLVCSKGLTNDVMMQAQPGVMGFFGLVSIMLWGGAYIAVSNRYADVRWLVGVFVAEKLVYVLAWLGFLSAQSLGAVYEQDTLAGIFYTIYGANDFIFMLFFAYVFLKSGRAAE